MVQSLFPGATTLLGLHTVGLREKQKFEGSEFVRNLFSAVPIPGAVVRLLIPIAEPDRICFGLVG